MEMNPKKPKANHMEVLTLILVVWLDFPFPGGFYTFQKVSEEHI